MVTRPTLPERTNACVSREWLLARYSAVRSFTEELCLPLVTEDYVIQSMPDVSPTKWHLAHVSWFFETFVLQSAIPGYQSLHPQYNYLFNSYYNTVGKRHCRPKRGLISRPTVEETYRYRAYIDRHMEDFLANAGEETLAKYAPIVEVGIHHEQQHQELMVTDIKHVFWENPLRPAYIERSTAPAKEATELEWVGFDEAVYCIGHDGGGFAYDNEGPRHREFVESFEIASRLVANGEYLEFMADGGYERPQFWLSEGWNTVQARGWDSPMYWEKDGDAWQVFTLAGMKRVDASEPVCHLSLFEADAFATWAGARLPTEAEWEIAGANMPLSGNFVEGRRFHPASVDKAVPGLAQMYGDVWEWTRSPYIGYPGYTPPPGALGEYNGKFMCNQYVLRGVSCATSETHIRPTYRNFFGPDARWQFMGLRLAREATVSSGRVQKNKPAPAKGRPIMSSADETDAPFGLIYRAAPAKSPAKLDFERNPAAETKPVLLGKQDGHADGTGKDPFFVSDVLAGLTSLPKTLPCKYFYDKRGSQLFDLICELDEYYPTRTETSILCQNIDEIVRVFEPGALVVEYGSGSSKKTRILLDRLPWISGYVPVDISREHLATTAEGLRSRYPHIPVMPVCADYTDLLDLPALGADSPRVVAFFPGSTIGNFHPGEAVAFLSRIAHVCGQGGGLLIGVDLQKDLAVVELAYNDRQGVTAAFNLNLLHRINCEAGGDLALDRFMHHAFYNTKLGRIEMHLVSRRDQMATIAGRAIEFHEGETILTECSYKYTLPQFAALANDAGFKIEQVWTDPKTYFSVQYLTVR